MGENYLVWRQYTVMFLQIRDKASIIPLVAGLRRDVLNQVSEGMALVWESYKLDPYVQRLSDVVLQFQEKVNLSLFDLCGVVGECPAWSPERHKCLRVYR